MKFVRILVAVMLAAMPVSPSFALQSSPSTDAMIEGAKLCTRHLPRYEREYAIPTHLLSAIASTESGRFHEGLGMKLPWPWSINANGKSYFFDSKEDAISAVRKLRARGVQSIDVGCMQVNLYHHPEAFASLNEAFEPQNNIAYAASFLRSLYDEGGSWKRAAGNYHSRTPSLGAEYVGQVYDSWYTIIDKLRAARLTVPEASVSAMNELKNATHQAPVVHAANGALPRVIHVASAEPVHEKVYSQEAQTPTFEHPHMNSISISSESEQPQIDYRQSSSILVIPPTNSTPVPVETPEIKTASIIPVPAPAASTPEIKTADSTPMQTPIPAPVQHMVADSSGRAMSAANDMTASTLSILSPSSGRRELPPLSSDRSGPNFIFND